MPLPSLTGTGTLLWMYMGYNESEFYSTKSDFMELMCKKFSECENNGKPVSFIQHNNAPENKVLIKISTELQWRPSIIAEYTGKSTPQRNQLVELGLEDIAGKARAMMVQANLPEEMKYKLWKECFNCAMYFSNLAVVTLNGKAANRYEHFYKAKPCYAKHLRKWGEVGTVSMGKNGKVDNRGLERCDHHLDLNI